MRNRKRLPGSLDEAIEMNFEAAEHSRRPMKVLADLMGVDLKTLYRWRAESSMPLNRIRQCAGPPMSASTCAWLPATGWSSTSLPARKPVYRSWQIPRPTQHSHGSAVPFLHRQWFAG